MNQKSDFAVEVSHLRVRSRKVISATILVASFIVLLALGDGSHSALAIQTPINVVSAVWVTSDVTYETGRSWTEIDAAPGDRNARFRVTIQNLSNVTMSGITADLLLQYPFENVTGGGVSRAYYAGSISPGANSYADFFLNIRLGTRPGEYKFKMALNYLELAVGTGKTLYFLKSTEVIVPVVLSSTQYMSIYGLVLSPSATVPAGNFTVSGNLLNIGKVSALNTNVTVTSPILIRRVSMIVGQVDPNVPRPFSAGVQLKRDIPTGQHIITISASYADSMAFSHTSQADTRLTVRPAEPRQPPVVEKQDNILATLIQILRDLLSILFGLTEMPSILLQRRTDESAGHFPLGFQGPERPKA